MCAHVHVRRLCVHTYSYSFIPRSSVWREERLVSTVCNGVAPQVFVGNLETVAILVHVVRLKHGSRLYLQDTDLFNQAVSYTLDKVSIVVTEFLYTSTYNKDTYPPLPGIVKLVISEEQHNTCKTTLGPCCIT